MEDSLTFPTTADRVATLVASLIFLVPGLSAVVFGVLTFAGLTWVDNTANGIMVGTTGAIWALVGFALLRFKRWTTVDVGARQIERGTRTLFKHPSEKFPFDHFRAVEIRAEKVSGGQFFVVVLHFDTTKRPGRSSHPELWLHTWGTVEEAREAGAAVAGRLGHPLTDSTHGEPLGE